MPYRKNQNTISAEVESLKKQMDIQAAISLNVCSQYCGTLFVDLTNEMYRYVDIREKGFINKIPESGMYQEFLNIYGDYFVHPEDKERVIDNMQIAVFKGKAGEEYGYRRLYFQFRRLYDEHYEWVEMMLSQKTTGPEILIITLRNINDEKQRQMEQEKVLRAQNDIISDNYWKTVDLMASLLEHRSLESGDHIRRIKNYVKLILDQASLMYPDEGLDERTKETIVNLSALHDIGKIGIPDAILQKPGKLTEDEYNVMKTHPAIGSNIARTIPNISTDPLYTQMSYEICRYHHERYDGNGYPNGLLGDEIPFCAQIVGIADVYDALTSERVYKAAYPHAKAMNMIFNYECGVFSDELFAAFENAVGGGWVFFPLNKSFFMIYIFRFVKFQTV